MQWNARCANARGSVSHSQHIFLCTAGYQSTLIRRTKEFGDDAEARQIRAVFSFHQKSSGFRHRARVTSRPERSMLTLTGTLNGIWRMCSDMLPEVAMTHIGSGQSVGQPPGVRFLAVFPHSSAATRANGSCLVGPKTSAVATIHGASGMPAPP